MVAPVPVAPTPDKSKPFDPEPWGELASDLIEGKGELTPKWLGSAATLVATTFGGPWAGAITGTLATALAVALGTTGTARLEAAEKEYAQRETLQQDVTRAVVAALQTEGCRLFEAARGEREMGKTTLAHAMVQGLLWLEQRGQLQSSELQAAIATNADRLSEQSASEFVETIKYILQQEEATRRQIGAQLNEGFARLEQLLSAVLQSLGEQRPGAARAMLRRQLPDRDPRFVGRETELEDLHQRLGQTLAIGVTQRLAAWGHGGLGKSSLAIEYAWRHASSYPGGVLFLHAENNVSVALAEWAPLYGVGADSAPVRKFAELSSPPTRDVAELARIVRAALSDGEPALLIVDNVPDAAWLREHRDELPSRACRLVFTTRASQLPAVTMLPLDRLDDAAAKSLLAAYRADAADPNASSAVGTIVRLTGGLAVAVVTVGAYLARLPQLSWDSYAKSLEQRGLASYEQTAQQAVDSLNYPPSLAVIFSDLYGAISPSEQRALDYAALLGASSFPEFWLETLLAQEPSAESEALPGFEDAPGASVLTGLKEARVLRVESVEHGVRFLSIHALLRDWLRQEYERRRCVVGLRKPMMRLVTERAEAVNRQALVNPVLRAELTPLVAIAEDLASEGELTAGAKLAARLSMPLLQQARFGEALGLHVPFVCEHGHTLGDSEWALGSTLLSNLAVVLRELGDFHGARTRLEQAISIVGSCAPNHPILANDYSNLATVLRELGDFHGARMRLEQAIAIDEACHPPSHASLAFHYSTLGLVLRDLGDLHGARKRLEQALSLQEADYTRNHPILASDYSNLGLVLRDLGLLQDAKRRFEQAVAISQEHYPPNHPTLATTYSNLGLAMKDLGDLKNAKKRFEQAIAISGEHYPPNHPTLATNHSNLGLVLHDLGDFQGAKRHLAQALAIDQGHCAPNHPTLAISYSNLASVLVLIGERERACALWAHAQEIFMQHFPETHPHVRMVMGWRFRYCAGQIPGF